MNRTVTSILRLLAVVLALGFVTSPAVARQDGEAPAAQRLMPVFVEDATGDRPGTDGAAMVAALNAQIADTPGLRVVQDPAQAAVTITYFIWTTPFETPPAETFRNYALIFTQGMTVPNGAELVKVQVGSEEGDLTGMHREAIHKLMDLRADLIAWQDSNPPPPAT
ncbi:MAG: hypothetical protein V4701_12995 [Pseudomonadota bacterium]